LNDDPRLTDITSEVKKLEKQYDDIIWDYGINDPRLAQLGSRLTDLKTKLENGELFDPNF
jgi:hypothetical protein